MRRRLRRIIERMLDGEEFYTNSSPRITRAEIKELDSLGLIMQVEHTHGAMPGPIAVYPLYRLGSLDYGDRHTRGEFEKLAKELLAETGSK